MWGKERENKKKEEKYPVKLRLAVTANTKDTVQTLAKKRGVSVTGLLRIIIRDYLERQLV